MHRAYIPPTAWTGATLTPDREEAHHLTHVLRLRSGEIVTAFDGRGRSVAARLAIARETGGKSSVTLVCDPESVRQQPGPFPITLIQAVIKGPRMDMLIEKAAELGATRIVPVQAERSVVRLAGEQAEERRERWQRIAVGAAKQCGQDWLPDVAPIASLAEALRELARVELCLLGSLQPGAPEARTVIDVRRQQGLASAAWIIGPEGDLTEAEHAACLAAGAVAVRMGPRVLRAETAAMFAISALTFALAR